MNSQIITDSIYDALEELILDDISYIDSAIFSETTTGVLIDNMFKYIDHLLMHRRTETPDYIVYSTGTLPQMYTYITNNNIPRGAYG